MSTGGAVKDYIGASEESTVELASEESSLNWELSEGTDISILPLTDNITISYDGEDDGGKQLFGDKMPQNNSLTNSNIDDGQNPVQKVLKYQCEHCNYETTRRMQLSRHKEVKHENIKHNCPQCDYNSAYKKRA